MMVLGSWKQQCVSEFVLPNTVLWNWTNNIPAEGSNFRFSIQPGSGSKCCLRFKHTSEWRTKKVALVVYSKARGVAISEGVCEFGDWNRDRSRKFPTSVAAVAEAHEAEGTEDILGSSNGDDASANKISCLSDDQRWRVVKGKLAGLLSNAQKHSRGIQQVRHSLGVDFGDAKTGVSVSLKGYAPRPLTVVRMRGDKLIEHLLHIAARERADEFIVGLPVASDGKETVQSNKTRSFAGRLAGQAALRGWRVYLHNEYGSSQDGLGYMLEMGVKKRSRKEMIDSYAAVVLLSTYFNSGGARAELLVPKGLAAQEQLCLGSNLVVGDNLGRVKTYDLDENDNYEYDD